MYIFFDFIEIFQLKYEQFEKAISAPRLQKYLADCAGNSRKALMA
jgi:hypothetical protein